MTDKFDSLLQDVYASLIVSEAEAAAKPGQLTPLDQITPAAQRYDGMPAINKLTAGKNLRTSSKIKKRAKKVWDGPMLAKLNKDAEKQLDDFEASIE